MNETLRIRHEDRQSLALRATPEGILVLLPRNLDPDSAEVRAFLQEGLPKLSPPAPISPDQRLDEADIRDLVATWAETLGVRVQRLQLRQMRRKWGSMSTRGTLTLASDLTQLPRDLAEYVVVHELLHLQVARHGGLFELLLTRHISDWRERVRELGRWTVWIGKGG